VSSNKSTLAHLGQKLEKTERSFARMNTSTILKTVSTLLAVMLLTAVAVGCGEGEAALPAPTATQPPPPPTATPVPPTPTPEDGLAFEYTEYSHPTGAFAIEYPSAWIEDDRSRPDTVFVSWYPEEGYPTLSVFISTLSGIADPQAQIDGLINEWMVQASGFATDPDYRELSRELQGDGSVLLRFYYTREGEPTQAGCFFDTRGNLFSSLCFGAPEERWDELLEDFNYIADSYAITSPATEGLLFEYVEYVHPSGVFSIEYPQDWEIEDLSTAGENIVISFSSAELGAFVIPALVDASVTLDEENMNTFVESFLGAGFSARADYQELGRHAQTGGGVLVTFRYTEGSEAIQAGALFEQRGTLVSALTIGALAEEFANLVNDLDHIGNSYTVDETAWPY
jgi:hypothetical protein